MNNFTNKNSCGSLVVLLSYSVQPFHDIIGTFAEIFIQRDIFVIKFVV